ncbi:MAG: hypothetical protein E7282_11355 [Lachnospiraceae bacterium]|nr:hypothetical protein [Lachnospiraceae bacterium]
MAQKTFESQEQKTKEEIKAEQKVRQLEASLAAAKKDAKEAKRKADDSRKYMMGGVVWKYFPECVQFSELEMNRIIACAFSLDGVKNMIERVRKERKNPAVENDKTKNANEADPDDDNQNENDDEEEADDEGEDA